MNFFTSLAQLRHGFGGPSKTSEPTTYVERDIDPAPKFKEALYEDPPAPILDDAAIMARAALAAQAVAAAAEVEYEKHTQGSVDWSEMDGIEDMDPDLEMPDMAFDRPLEELMADLPEDMPAPTSTLMDLAFDDEDVAPLRFINGFDPDKEALEIEIQRAPGDTRPLASTDMALFLHKDGTYGADIMLRLAATDTAPAVCTNLRLCGAGDIDLDKVTIKVINPTV